METINSAESYIGHVPCLSHAPGYINAQEIGELLTHLGASRLGEDQSVHAFSFNGTIYTLRQEDHKVGQDNAEQESGDITLAFLSNRNDLLVSKYLRQPRRIVSTPFGETSYGCPPVKMTYLLEDDELARLAFKGFVGDPAEKIKELQIDYLVNPYSSSDSTATSFKVDLGLFVKINLNRIVSKEKPPNEAIFEIDYMTLVHHLDVYMQHLQSIPFFMAPELPDMKMIEDSIRCIEKRILASYLNSVNYDITHSSEVGREHLEDILERFKKGERVLIYDKKQRH